MKATSPCICISTRHVAQTLTEFYDRILAPSGLKVTQFSLLRELELQSPLSISELAHRLDLDRTTMGRNLRVLAQDDFVSFSPGLDRREHVVQMTSKGKQALTTAFPLWEKAQNTLTTTLGQEQISTFTKLLSTLETATT